MGNTYSSENSSGEFLLQSIAKEQSRWEKKKEKGKIP